MRAAVGKNHRFMRLSLLVVFLFSVLGIQPSAATSLPTMICEYYARQAFQSVIGRAYPGMTLTSPDCKFPEGTSVSYIWSAGNLPIVRTQSLTVPNLIGNQINLAIEATNPKFALYRIYFVGTIACLLPDFSLSVEGEKLTPKTPVIVRASSPEDGVSFTLNQTFPGTTQISNGVWKFEIMSGDREYGYNQVRNFSVRQAKANCHATSKSVSIPLKHQLGPIVIGPQTGELVRVGVPVVLKRQAFSSTATIRYRWEVADQTVSTSSSFTPRISDLYKTVRLYLSIEDSALGLGLLEVSVDEEYSGVGVVYPALLSASPSPTPSPSASAPSTPGLNPQAPSQPGNIASPSPRPLPSVSPSVRPSPTPTTNPIPSARPSVSPRAVVYNNCTALRIVFRNGVARDSSSLNRYKLKTKPVLNNSVYLANARLDTDKDGLVCER